MWFFSPWKVSSKIIITILVIPLFMFQLFQLRLWWALFSSQTGIDTAYYNQKVDKSGSFSCSPKNNQWSMCTHSKYGVSFEYPKDWHFVQIGDTAIKLGPNEKDLSDNYYVEFQIYEGDSAQDTYRLFNSSRRKLVAFFSNSKNNRVNGMRTWKREVDRDHFSYSMQYLNGKYLYTFGSNMEYSADRDRMPLSEEQYKSIFEHMAQSLKVEHVYADEIKDPVIKTTAYKDAQYPISFVYPNSWKVVQGEYNVNPESGVNPLYSLHILAPDDNPNDGRACSVDVSIYAKEADMTLGQWRENIHADVLKDPKADITQSQFNALTALDYFDFKGKLAGSNTSHVYIATKENIYKLQLLGEEEDCTFSQEIIIQSLTIGNE